MSLICLVTLSIRNQIYVSQEAHYDTSQSFSFYVFSPSFYQYGPDTENNWTYSAACKCILGLSIVLIFKIQGSNWVKRTTWIIFLSLCVLMILQNQDLILRKF